MKCECGGELTKEFGLTNSITGEKRFPMVLCSGNKHYDEITIHSLFDRAEKAEAALAEAEAKIEAVKDLFIKHCDRKKIGKDGVPMCLEYKKKEHCFCEADNCPLITAILKGGKA
jgi:hypothetical protein